MREKVVLDPESLLEGRHLRVPEFAERTGYEISTVRKKLLRREIGYRKCGRIILIPESEIARLVGPYQPPILTGEGK